MTELASRTGLSQVHIGRIEKAQSSPTADVIRKLSEALEVTCGYLMDGDVSGQDIPKFQDPEFYRRFREAESLPTEERDVVGKLLDAFIFRAQVKKMA